MRPERWEQVDRLFEAVLDREPERRAAFLDEQCGGDRELRDEVESLLFSYEQAGSFMDQPPAKTATELLADRQRGSVADRNIGPYKVLSLLGRGGMAAVYRAEDTRLHRVVALKVLAPMLAQDPRAKARFVREAQATRGLDHPNIGSVYEAGEDDGELYIAMELYEGETLHQRLRHGPLPLQEAERILRQIVSALAAAHAAGIVHRDLKPANVMLVASGEQRAEQQAQPANALPGTRDSEAAGPSRPVLLDFGLAKLLSEVESTGGPLTGSGQMLGTMAYMAPEQLRGEPVTAAVDVYALGIVAYEMLTDVKPFGDDPTAAAVRRLTRSPPSPREHVPELDRKWEELILGCLEREPKDRYASAVEVLRVLEGGESMRRARNKQSHNTAASSEALAGKQRRWAVLAGGAAILLVLVAAASQLPIGDSVRQLVTLPRLGLVEPQRSVAVLGFKNLSGSSDKAWLSTAISEMLAADLSAGQRLRILPGDVVAQVKRALELPEAETLDRQGLTRIWNSLGADLVISGSYLSVGQADSERLSVVFRLQDAEHGQTLASLRETGTEAELFELIGRAGVNLRAELGVPSPSATEAESVLASLPSNLEAARLYVEGLSSMRRSDLSAAAEFLEKAVAADSDYVFAHSALARVWKEIGYEERAQAEAKRAFELSSGLSREARLLVEGDYQEAATEWSRAVDIYRSLFELHPENIDYGLRLASAQGRIYGRGAYATLEALRRLPPPTGDLLQIDLTEIEVASWMSDYERLLAAASRTVEKARAQGAWLLAARGLGRKCWALLNLGQPNAALTACEEARTIQAEKGDRSGLARTLNSIAILHLDRGDLTGAQRLTEEVLTLYREVGNQHWVTLILGNLGDVLYDQGDLPGARKAYEEAVARMRTFAEHNSGLAMGLGQLGNVLRQQGDLAAARTAYEEAMERSRKAGHERWRADALAGFGALLLAGADTAGAREVREEALRIWTDLEDALKAGRSRLALAEIDLVEARATLAEAGARQAMQEFRGKTPADDEALAFDLLARALLAQGRLAEALEAAASATTLADQRMSPPTRLPVLITAARTRAASPSLTGDAALATKSLNAALAEADELGCYGLGLDARLALGEIELASGRSEDGRTRLEALEREATDRGYLLIAKRAAVALKARQ